uniref:Transposase n=1 Tax=Globodera rostochiensis TaxID=31243 RepID=A0A914GVH1_GLORO
MSQWGEQNKLCKDLSISYETFVSWKKEFGLPIDSQIKYSDSEKLKFDIVKRLNISSVTLYKWKKQFDSVDEHSLAEERQSFADNDTSEHPMPSSDDNLWAWNMAKKKRTERIEVEHSVQK